MDAVDFAGARVIVVNESWRLAPWAHVLYACDPVWWGRRAPPADRFTGIRVTQDEGAARLHGLRKVTLTPGVHRILMRKAGVIGWGGNSGFHAVNIAAQAMPARICLVGFDYSAEHGTHWHGKHDKPLNNPLPSIMRTWAQRLDSQAGVFAELGIQVVNCSPTSALKAYPVMTLEEALVMDRSRSPLLEAVGDGD